MAKRITKKETINSVVIETSEEAIANAEVIATDAASSVSVFTGATKAGETKTVAKTTVKGGASNAAVRDVAVGATFAPGENSLDENGVNQFSSDYIVDASGEKRSVQWTLDKNGKIVAPKLAKGESFVSEIVINSDNEISIENVAVKGSVYGGAVARDIKGKTNKKDDGSVSAIVNGTSTLNLTNISVSKVFGGGAGYGSVLNGSIVSEEIPVLDGAGEPVLDTEGNPVTETISHQQAVVINYNSGKVSTLYGGGDEGSVVNGNIDINILGMAEGKISKIYAGGKNSTVNGDVTITFGPNGGNVDMSFVIDDKYIFSGVVSGGGDGKNAIVNGRSDLVFSNYSAEFKGTIKDFETVTISGQSNVTFTKGQDKSMKGATYQFVINDDSVGLTSAMLTWNKKVDFSKIVVSVETRQDFSIVLLSSNQLKKEEDFDFVKSITVVNEDGNALYKGSYVINYAAMYEYNEKNKLVKVRDAGTVSIEYVGSNLTFDEDIYEKVTLSDADDEVNLIAGADLKQGLDTAGGNDRVTLAEGAKITGSIDLGSGTNTLVIQKDAQLTGSLILEEGSANRITVNSGALSSIEAGDGSNNIITLNGNAVYGGGVGYWETMVPPVIGSVYIDLGDGTLQKVDADVILNENPNKIFVVGNLDLRGSNSNDTIYVNNNAAVNSIYLGGGDDVLEIGAGAKIGYTYVSPDANIIQGDSAVADIDLGSGNNVLVLKEQLGDVVVIRDNTGAIIGQTWRNNVNVVADKGSKNAIVIGKSMTVDNAALLSGSTDNTLVLSNGVVATFRSFSIGNFIGDDDAKTKFSGVYLGQNAVIQDENAQVAIIQNYAGNFESAANVYVIGNPENVPSNIEKYYSKDTEGVDSARIVSNSNITLVEGAAVANSQLSAANTVTVREGATVSDTRIWNTETVRLAGTVSGGSVESVDRLVITSVDALVGKIDDVDTVWFNLPGAEYVNEALSISNIGALLIDADSTVTVGSFDGSFLWEDDNYVMMSFENNAKFIAGQNIVIDDADVAQTFEAGYSVEIFGTIDADVTFNGNTVKILSGRNDDVVNSAIAITGDIVGAADFVIGKGVSTWFDVAQFQNFAETTFTVESDAFLAFDGVISAEDQAALIESVKLDTNGKFGLGAWLVIQNWNGTFDMDVDGVVGGFDQNPELTVLNFTDLYVKNNATINGQILMNDAANNIVIGENVTVNGARDLYDYGAILTQGGDDTMEIRAGSVINGAIDMGAGDDTLTMTGVTVNYAVNQQQGDKVAAPVIAGVETLNLNDGNVINGSAFFSGSNEINSDGVNTVNGKFVFGANSANEINVNSGTLSVNEIAFAGYDADAQQFVNEASTAAASNKINVKGELALNAGLELKATGANEINVDGGTISGITEIEMNGGKNVNADAQVTKVNAAASNTLKVAGSEVSLTSVDMVAGTKNAVEVAETGVLTVDHLDMSGAITMPTDLDDPESKGAVVAAAGTNEIKNKGTLNLGSVHAAGTANTVENSGTLDVLDAVVLAGAVTVGDDAKVTYSAAETNEIKNTASLSASSLVMRGDANTINSIGTVEVAGSLDMIGQVVVDPNADVADREVVNGAGSNTIALFDSENKASLDAHTASLSAAMINLNGENNTINGKVVLDTTNDKLVDSSNSITAGAINTTVAGAVNMESAAGANAIDMGIAGNVVGVVLTDSKVTFGPTAQAINGDVTMTSVDADGNGGTNKLALDIALASTNDSDIVAGDLSVALTGDVAMTGQTNTLSGNINLSVRNHGAITAGNLAVSVTGDIVMDTLNIVNASNKVTFGSAVTDDPNAGEIAYTGIAITVDGDITMKGLRSNNTLYFGNDVTYTGNIVMGNTDMTAFSASNTLTIMDVANVDIQNLTMIARKNTIVLQGEGEVSFLNDIRGAVNDFKVGKGVEIVGDIVFNDIVNEDKKGQDGYIVLANTQNVLRIEGATANNISSIASGANTTIWVGFENTPAFEDAADSVVNGDLNMGTAESTGNNALNVVSTIVTEKLEDGSEVKHGFTGTVNGNVEMNTSAAGTNTVTLKGAVIDADEDIAGSIRQVFQSVINGKVNMTSEAANTITAELATITGDVTMIGSSNTIAATKAVQFGTADTAADIAMDAVSVSGYNTGRSGNSLTLAGIAATAADLVATPEASYEGTEAEQATAGNIVMASANGSNTATITDATVGTIEMDASVVPTEMVVPGEVEKANSASNTLTLTGSVKTDSVWSDDFKAAVAVDTVNAVNTDAIVMTAANSNTFNAAYANIDGALEMTANGINTDDGKVLYNSATLSVVDVDGITMNAVVPASATTTTANNDLVISGIRTAGEVDTVKRSNVGDVTMSAASNNQLTVGMDALASIGAVTMANVVMNASGANTINVSAGTLKKYENGPAAGTEVNFRAEATAIDMNGKWNTLNVNAGTFGIKGGNVTMTNLDADGVVISNTSINMIQLSQSASLLLDNGGLQLGSAGLSVVQQLGGTYINGTEVTLQYVNEYGEYIYAWEDGATAGGDPIATTANMVTVNGKLYTTADSELVAMMNSISVTGPAVKDPTVDNPIVGADPTVSSAVFTNLVMQGVTGNSITTNAATAYKASFEANSVTMGGIADGEVVLANAMNTITVAANTFFNVATAIDMTATTSNTITANNFTNVASETDLASATVAGMFLANAGEIVKAKETLANTLGNVSMTATGIIDADGNLTTSGSNALTIGANTVAGTVAMNGVTNSLTLNGYGQMTYDVVNADKVAVNQYGNTAEQNAALAADDPTKEVVFTPVTETVIEQAAAKAEAVTFTIGNDALKAALANAAVAGAPVALTNTVVLYSGSSVASITSTDTYTYVDATDTTVTVGSNDSITLFTDATVAGAIDLGYGDDTITLNGANVSLKDIDFGAGNDVFDLNGYEITVDGDITYDGILTVKNGTITFTEGHAFVGDQDNLFFDGMTVYGNIDTNVKTLSALTVGNGTLSASISYVNEEAGELNVAVETNADGEVVGSAFAVTSTGSVNFYDSAAVEVAEGDVPATVTAYDDVLNVAAGAQLTLGGAVNFGAGDNAVNLGAGASLVLDAAWTSEAAFVREGTTDAVNAAGQTVEEWIAADPDNNTAENFVANVQAGTVAVAMEDASVFTVNAAAAADVTLVGIQKDNPDYEVGGTEPQYLYGSYVINGTALLTGNVGVDSSAAADAEYTVELSTALKGNVTLGENADTLNLAAAVEGAIDMGNGDDIVNLSAGAQFTSLSNAETLNVNGDFTVNAPAVDDVAAYNQLATATAVVVKAGTLTLGAADNISSITMEGGALTGAAYTGDVVVEGAAALSDITIDGSVTSSADLTLSGALYVANGLVLQQAVDADGNAVNTNIAIDSATFNGNLSMLALSNTTGSDNQILNVTVNGPISANGVYVEANGALSVTGNVTTGEIALDAGASVSVAGTLSGADLTLSNNGTAVFGAVAYTGTVTVAAGSLSAASLTADTVSGKVEITGVLTGQNLSAVEAESQAGTLMFVGDAATFASANFVADTLTKIDFTSADLTGAVTDTSTVADWVSMAAKFDVFGTALKTGDFYTNTNLSDLDSLATTDDVTGDMSITFQDGIVFTKLSGGTDYEYTDANSNKYKLGLSGNTLGIASV